MCIDGRRPLLRDTAISPYTLAASAPFLVQNWIPRENRFLLHCGTRMCVVRGSARIWTVDDTCWNRLTFQQFAPELITSFLCL